MPILLGRQTTFSMVDEATWATEVSPRTVTQRLISSTLQEKVTVVPLPHLYTDGGGPNTRDSYQSEARTKGVNKAVMAYSGNACGIVLKHLLGGVATTGSGPYTHTVTPAEALPAGMSGALQRGTDVAEEFYGLKVVRAKLSVEVGKAMELEYEVLGKNGAARAAASPSFPAVGTILPVLHHHAGSLTFNAQSYTVKRFSLTIENKLFEEQELGSLYITEPGRGDSMDIHIEAELNSRENQLYAAHRALTQGDVVLAFTDSPRSLTFTGRNARIVEYSDAINTVGIIKQNVKWKCFSDGTNYGVDIALVNAVATLIAS